MGKIAFIGGGNMAEAIIGGLIADGTVPDDIIVMDPNLGQRDRLHETLGIGVTDNVSTAIELAETIVLAIKPQIIPKVAESITEVPKHPRRPFAMSLMNAEYAPFRAIHSHLFDCHN